MDTLEIMQNEILALSAKISILESRLDAYKENSTDMLTAVGISAAILLGVFVIVNVSQLVINIRDNRKALKNAETSFEIKADEKLSGFIESQRKSVNSFSNSFNNKLDELRIIVDKNNISVIDTSNVNVELLDLASLLERTLDFDAGFTFGGHTEDVLDGIIVHLNKHSSIMDYEAQRTLDVLEKVDKSYSVKVSKIKALVSEKAR